MMWSESQGYYLISTIAALPFRFAIMSVKYPVATLSVFHVTNHNPTKKAPFPAPFSNLACA
jgi:hypothetical protein